MTIIGYVVGVFDCFHSGHINIISKSMLMCDTLIIGVHSDEFAMSYKRKPQDNEDVRRQKIIEYFKYNPEHVVTIDDNHIRLIKQFNITKIFHGDDWEMESYKKQIKYEEHKMGELGVEIALIPYTKGISTTDILKNNLFDMSDIKSIYFDLDNTLILNHKPLPHAIQCIDECRKHNYEIKIVTNNNRYSPLTLHKQLQMLGFNITENEITSSLHHVIDLCKKKYKNNKILIWGTNDAKEFLKKNEINVVSSKPDVIFVLYRNDFHYSELVELATLIKNGVPYNIGNTDILYPDVCKILPDTGTIAKLLEYTTNKEPSYILGKTTYILNNSNVLYIGDNEKTDKVFAHINNFKFLHIGNTTNCDISHLGVLIDYINK